MQRVFTLAALALVAGGGWTLFGGVSPEQIRQASQVVQRAVAAGAPAPTATDIGWQPPAPSGGKTIAPGGSTYGAFNAAPSAGAPPTIRIASFNIEKFGKSKASKADVMWKIARVVRMFDVVAIQEITIQDDYFVTAFLRDYVNAGLRDGDAWYDARVSQRLGRTRSTEQYAFLFNTSTIEVHPRFCFVAPDPTDLLHRPPHVALFQTRVAPPLTPFTFMLMNVHTDPDEAREELDALYSFYRQAQRATIDGHAEDDIIVLGDFNTATPASSRGGPPTRRARSLRPSDVGRLAEAGVTPVVRDEATNVVGTKLHDNLFFSGLSTIEFTGRGGVLDLTTDLGRPMSLDEAREVSDHRPVWGEFSAVEGDGYRSVASRR